MNKRTLLDVCKYLLAFGLLAGVIYKYWEPKEGKGLHDVWQQYVVEGKPIHYEYLLAALVLFSAALLLTFVRWYVLVRAQDLPFRLLDAFRLGLVGFFFNALLPSSIGGDVIKSAVLVREQTSRARAVATVIMDRLLALWALFWFVALVGGAFWLSGSYEDVASDRSEFIILLAAGVCAASLTVWLLLGLLSEHRAEHFAGRLASGGKIGATAAELWRAVWIYRCRQKSVLLAMVLACVGFAGMVLDYYCCVLVLWDGPAGDPIPTLPQHFLIVPVGLIIKATPLFPGGAGIGELGFGVLYEWFRCDPASGILGTLVERVLSWGLGLVGYLVYLRMKSSVPASVEPAVKGVVNYPAAAAQPAPSRV